MPSTNPEANREAVRKHYYANKEKVMAKTKAYKKAQYPIRQQQILEYLSKNPCVGCGESDPIVLEFDHKDQDTKLAEVSRLLSNGVAMKRVWEEIEKCDVVCCNCHRRRTRKQLGWTNR